MGGRGEKLRRAPCPAKARGDRLSLEGGRHRARRLKAPKRNLIPAL